MNSTLPQAAPQAGQKIALYVAYLHRCIAGQSNQKLTDEQQIQLEKTMSRHR